MYLQNGGLRLFEVAHRRWGKDDIILNWAAKAAFQRVGTYWHMLPQASQARKAIWEAVNPHTGYAALTRHFHKKSGLLPVKTKCLSSLSMAALGRSLALITTTLW
jgi:hypothetical protein